jgi:hypothetical protein
LNRYNRRTWRAQRRRGQSPEHVGEHVFEEASTASANVRPKRPTLGTLLVLAAACPDFTRTRVCSVAGERGLVDHARGCFSGALQYYFS